VVVVVGRRRRRQGGAFDVGGLVLRGWDLVGDVLSSSVQSCNPRAMKYIQHFARNTCHFFNLFDVHVQESIVIIFHHASSA
jgi:hypothetical protein